MLPTTQCGYHATLTCSGVSL